jgi:hypothetical protein
VERRVAYMVSVGKPKGTRSLGKLGVDGKIILKGTCKNLDGVRDWIDRSENRDRWCA